MKNILISFLILILGFILGFFMSKKVSLEKPSYIKLPADYSHQELGLLKKGTRLKYDKSMPEGFTRYILYINIADADKLSLKKSKNINEIDPYWVEKSED